MPNSAGRDARAQEPFLSLVLCLVLALSARAQLPSIEEATASDVLNSAQDEGRLVTLVHFWATWCIPGREEFPALLRVGREFEHKRVRLVFVSADFKEDLADARRFLAEHGVTGRSYLKSGEGRRVHQYDQHGVVRCTAGHGRLQRKRAARRLLGG